MMKELPLSLQNYNEKSCVSMLQVFAQRNSPVEISVCDGEDNEPKWPSKARVLACDDQTWLVEKPDDPRCAAAIVRSKKCHVLLIAGSQRWSFIGSIIGQTRHALNRSQTLQAFRINLPRSVDSAQRRRHYRVSTEETPMPPVTMVPLPNDLDIDPTALANIPTLVRAPILDVSTSGIGVKITKALAKNIQCVDRFDCSIQLGQDAEMIALIAHKVHVIALDAQHCLLGLEFDEEDSADRKRNEDAITQFAVSLQRLQLQRDREKKSA